MGGNDGGSGRHWQRKMEIKQAMFAQLNKENELRRESEKTFYRYLSELNAETIGDVVDLLSRFFGYSGIERSASMISGSGKVNNVPLRRQS
jgi:hypothetical protein